MSKNYFSTPVSRIKRILNESEKSSFGPFLKVMKSRQGVVTLLRFLATELLLVISTYHMSPESNDSSFPSRKKNTDATFFM